MILIDGYDVSTTNLIKILNSKSDKNAKLFKLPKIFCMLFLKLIGKSGIYDRLFKNLDVDIAFTKEKFGWSPPYNLEDRIYKTVNYD
jgi:hypothetical protein